MLLNSIKPRSGRDRKSTRLNSSHSQISYAVFCLKKKQIHRPATLEAILDLEPLPVEIKIGSVASLKLQTPADGVIDFAVGDDLLDLHARMASLELGDGRVPECAL